MSNNKNKKKKKSDGSVGSSSVKMYGPLPLGSWLILFNCFVYGFTFRLDRAAVNAASKEVYYM